MPAVTLAPTARRILRSIGLAAFVLLVVAWAVIGPNRVLCVGADGHVGVELPQSACCDSGPGSQSSNAPDDCGPCVDLEVPGALPTTRSSQSIEEQISIPVPLLPVGRPVALAVDTDALHAHRRCWGADPPPRTLAHLRTVRIRC